VPRYSGANLTVTLNWRSASSCVVATAPPRAACTVNIAGIEAVAGGPAPIHRDVQIGLTKDPEYAEVGDAGDLVHLALDPYRDLFELCQVRTDDLDGIGAFDAGQAFLDVVLDVLGEVEADPGELLCEFGLQVFDQLFLGHAGRPSIERLERDEELGIEETGGVAAIVRPPVLGDDRDHLGVAQQNLPHFRYRGHGGFERDGRRHGRANPQIPFLQRGQEFRPEPRDQ